MMDSDAFPTQRGTYVLILRLQRPTRLTVGKLGTFDFAAGWYCYVGSAHGSGGLRGRLRHHLAPVGKMHWHIDYLRAVTPVHEVWWLASDALLEHRWADALRALPGATMPVPRFGASDCACATHLLCVATKPMLAAFRHHTTEEVVCTRLRDRITDSA